MPACDYPQCLDAELSLANRTCSATGCTTGIQNHMCCLEWLQQHSLLEEQTEHNKSYCWACLKLRYREQCTRSERAAAAGVAKSTGDEYIRVASKHTGVEFEQGLHRNSAGVADNTPRTPHQARAGEAGSNQPRRSPRLLSPHATADQRQGPKYEAWLGWAKKLEAVGKHTISHYFHRIDDSLSKVVDGQLVNPPRILYHTKYEPAILEREMAPGGFNPTRLGNYLIKSKHTPDDIKLAVASMMRSKIAMEYVDQETKKRAAGEDMAEQLHSARKTSKSTGNAHLRADERHNEITKYIAVDAAMPEGLVKNVNYYLSILIFMCRLPFSIVMNRHFIGFLWAIRPNYAKQFHGRSFRRHLATDLLDEAYEEAQEITSEALSMVPGRPTLGMDGHTEGKHRHVVTITKAKLGISTFAAAKYMRTTRTTGKNMASVAKQHLTPEYIALVADNTGNNTGENTGLFAYVKAERPSLFCLGCYVHVLGEAAPSLSLCTCAAHACPAY